MPIRRLFQLQARKSTIESSLDETEENQKSKPQVRKTMSTRSTPILRRRSRFMAMNRSYDSTDSSNCSGKLIYLRQ